LTNTKKTLRKLVADKIERYKRLSTFKDADTNPATAYELGRMDGLCEILTLIDKARSDKLL